MTCNTRKNQSEFSYNGKKIRVIAGPCSAETEEQLFTTAQELRAIGINTLRAGIWKPRSRAHHFEGVGEQGLQWMRQVQKELGMKVTTEVGNARHVELALKYGVDILWIGARTTTNPFSVQEVAEALSGTDIPVMVKNPVCPDAELWTGAVERLLACGIRNISLIHRGVCVPDSFPYRNAPCWEMAEQMRNNFPEFPVYTDPSHICGRRDLLEIIASKALGWGTDGLFIESHYCPSKALSDASQQIRPAELQALLNNIEITRKN